jgi:glycosyltransferase involved in cell wall biosynthesis
LGSSTPALITVLGSDFGLLHVPGMRLALRAMLRQRRAVLAPNAEWMVSALQQAFGDLAEVRAIPFGVDDAWFNLVREPASDGVCHWMAVTRITRAKIGDLFDWGGDLFGPKRQLHLFGPMQEQLEIPAWVQYHGPTHPADLINRWFPQASGLITLSKHDEGRPQIMLEAMAASLPVLASDLPAHRDMVLQDQTGCLVANRTQLVDSLARLEDPTHNQSTGLAARQWVKNTVGTWDDCASRYANVYRDLLGTRA